MFESVEGQGETPRINQLSIYLPNRVGSLLAVTRCLDAFGIQIRALSILDSADHAVVRLVVDRPGFAADTLRTEGYAVFETDLLGVTMPDADSEGIRKILSALLMAELNVHYVYSLLARELALPILAIHVEDFDAASEVLRQQGLELIGQADLE